MIITAEVSELTRKIKLPTDRVLSVNGDYQVDGIAFKLPATYEGDFDFSTAAARVHWTGVDKVEHTNLITEEDVNGYPLWVMPSELTQGGHGVIEFAISFVATDETAAVTKRWISDPVSFRNRRTVNGSNEDEEAEEETTYDRLASAIADVRAAQASVDDVAEVLSSLGTLTFHFVDAKADMTDQTKLYVLTTDGYLYHYSTAASDFVPAFEVGGSQEVIDARTDENGTTYANLKTRINTGFTQLKEDLSDLSVLPESVEEMGKRLDLTTEGIPNAQIVNMEGYEIYNNGGNMGYRNVIVPYPGDGVYYYNPIVQSISRPNGDLVFLDENGENIKIYNASGNEVSSINNSCSYDPFEFDGLTVTRVQYSYYSNLVSGTVRARQSYTLASTPAFLKFTTVYTTESYSTGDRSKALFGLTKDAWYEEYKPYGGFDYQYADGLIDAIEDFVGISNSKVIAPVYDATATYAVNDYVLYGGKLYKCITAISTAEAWNSTHWEESLLAGEFKDINESVSMCVEEKETIPEPTSGIQCANPSRLRIVPTGNTFAYYYDWIDVSRDGIYYRNPYSAGNPLSAVTFFNKYGERLVGKSASGDEITSLSSIFNTENSWVIISDSGRCLSTYVRNGERSDEIFFDCEIAYIEGYNLRATDSESWGVTYNEYFDTYIQYDGAQEPTSLKKAYNTDVAKFVRDYLGMYGLFVGNEMYDFTYPQKADSVFTKAVKYYMQRFNRERNNIIRFASFNKFVARGRGNWPDIKKELTDYAVDICGFQECAPVTSEGVVTNEIGSYLQGYQFNGYVPQNANVDKALVTHWELSSSDNLTILTYDGGVSTCVRGKMNIIPPLWYSNAISNAATLSVYSCHLSSGGKTIDGTSYSSFEIRKKEIEGLLAIIAEDTSDFIVVVGDTNCFETGFDIPTGTHYEWEMFRQAGLTPALPGYESTVTENLPNRYFCKADNGKVYCIAAYDQIFFSANVSVDNYGVIDSHRYMMESIANTPISDHCMIYADLKFDFEAVAQNKLKDIAVTQPWW